MQCEHDNFGKDEFSVEANSKDVPRHTPIANVVRRDAHFAERRAGSCEQDITGLDIVTAQLFGLLRRNEVKPILFESHSRQIPDCDYGNACRRELIIVKLCAERASLDRAQGVVAQQSEPNPVPTFRKFR